MLQAPQVLILACLLSRVAADPRTLAARLVIIRCLNSCNNKRRASRAHSDIYRGMKSPCFLYVSGRPGSWNNNFPPKKRSLTFGFIKHSQPPVELCQILLHNVVIVDTSLLSPLALIPKLKLTRRTRRFGLVINGLILYPIIVPLHTLSLVHDGFHR